MPFLISDTVATMSWSVAVLLPLRAWYGPAWHRHLPSSPNIDADFEYTVGCGCVPRSMSEDARTEPVVSVQ